MVYDETREVWWSVKSWMDRKIILRSKDLYIYILKRNFILVLFNPCYISFVKRCWKTSIPLYISPHLARCGFTLQIYVQRNRYFLLIPPLAGSLIKLAKNEKRRWLRKKRIPAVLSRPEIRSLSIPPFFLFLFYSINLWSKIIIIGEYLVLLFRTDG